MRQGIDVDPGDRVGEQQLQRLVGREAFQPLPGKPLPQPRAVPRVICFVAHLRVTPLHRRSVCIVALIAGNCKKTRGTRVYSLDAGGVPGRMNVKNL